MKKITIYFVLLILAIQVVNSQEIEPEYFQNPILPGSYPDPSVCRVGEWYYMVNSSFLWWPGVPIHRSKDLVNWEHLGYVLSTKEHLDITDYPGDCGGPWAPTIRYNDSLFYVTVTSKGSGGDIVTTATNPEGPWAVPTDLKLGGIDGSLFFDDDKAWYCWSDDHKIRLIEFDKSTLSPVGEEILLLDEETNAQDYTYIEGPHIYKIDGKYVLLIANGGTFGNSHSVSLFRSDTIAGPYTEYVNNPVLSHSKHPESSFTTIGHADVFQTQNGDWWAVMLGKRIDDGLNIRDRETFLTPVTIEDGWFVFNPTSNGEVLQFDKRPDLPWTPLPQIPDKDDFNDVKLNFAWVHHRTPHENLWSTTERDGYLRINLLPTKINERLQNPTVVRRITQANFTATTKLEFTPQTDNEVAGLAAIINSDGSLVIQVGKSGTNNVIKLMKTEYGEQTEVASQTVNYSGTVYLQLKAEGRNYKFYAGSSLNELVQIGDVQDAEVISRKCFHGAGVGMYASSQGEVSSNYADFDWFEYIAEPAMREPDYVYQPTSGVNYSYYEGSWSSLPYFSSLTPIKSGVTTSLDPAQIADKNKDFGIVYKTYVKIPEDGIFKFILNGGEESVLTLGGSVINASGSNSDSLVVALKHGTHLITLEYFTKNEGDILEVLLQSPDGITKQISDTMLFTIPLQQAPSANHTVPGKIELEFYDYGGSGVSYHDNTEGNKGSELFDNEDVDIEVTSDLGGGYNIGWTNDGEWLEYTLSDIEPGEYDVHVRTATKNAGGSLTILIGDGNDFTPIGSIVPVNAGDWQNFSTQTIKNLAFDTNSGNILRLEIVGGNFNLNWIKIEEEEIIGITENDKLSNYKVFPNPFSNGINIMCDNNIDKLNICLYTLSGRKVYDKQVLANNFISLSFGNNLEKGVYFLHLSNNQCSIVHKIVRQ